MGKAYVLKTVPFEAVTEKRRVLVTGAAGRIGSYFAQHTNSLYELRLMVRGDEKDIDRIRPFGEVMECDLSDLDGLKRACHEVDTVVHLAADPHVHSTWDALLPNNIVGVYNLFEAARTEGCRRVIFASSVNAMNGYGHEVQIRSEDPVSPGNLYGVSKCFGEAMCRLYATKEDLSAIAIRIGAFQTRKTLASSNYRIPPSILVSPRDLCQLFVKCIDDVTLQFAIFQGLSNNRHNWFDISDAKELVGYRPQDDAFEGFDGFDE